MAGMPWDAPGRARDARRLDFREVDPEHWPDFERLFEARGGPKSSWCMLWRAARALGGVDEPGDSDRAVWSVVCFYVRRQLRGQRISAELLAAAIAHARSHGAVAVEA